MGPKSRTSEGAQDPKKDGRGEEFKGYRSQKELYTRRRAVDPKKGRRTEEIEGFRWPEEPQIRRRIGDTEPLLERLFAHAQTEVADDSRVEPVSAIYSTAYIRVRQAPRASARMLKNFELPKLANYGENGQIPRENMYGTEWYSHRSEGILRELALAKFQQYSSTESREK